MLRLFRKRTLKKEIRPMTLQDFVGQENAKLTLNIAATAAKERRDSLEHVIIYGPPGLGKTTLAKIITNLMNTTLHSTVGTSLQKQSDVVELFNNIIDGDIIFVDEIHRMPVKLEELLYTAMEDNYIDIYNDRIHVPRFTLIGATTRLGDLSEPLRDRFGIQLRLEPYNQQDMVTIAHRTAEVLGYSIQDTAASILASRARGTPRILNNFIKRARDITNIQGSSTINIEDARATLELLEIDKLGLDRMDRKILRTLIVDYNSGPVGINTLAVSVGENAKTIQEVYEPYLIEQSLLLPTSRGRVATKKAQEHMRGNI